MLDRGSIIENLPSIIPREPSSVIKRYIDAHDEEIDEYDELLEVAKASHQLDSASDGEYATGAVQFIVTESAISKIEEGTIVEADLPEGTRQFETTETVTIGASGGTFWGEDWDTLNWALSPQTNTVTVEANIKALETGTSHNLPANTIDTVINPPPGVQSVTNNNATTGGIITDLDEIGQLYGPLGDRGNRTDEQYRSYLKSLIPAFNGRGTVPGIKSAIAVGLGVDEEDIEVEEHFSDIEYSLIIKDWESHNGSTVEELADLADASVSRLRRTRYRNPDEVTLEDNVSITEGLQEEDAMSVGAEATANRRGVEDGYAVSEEVFINKNTVSTGGVDSEDTTFIDDETSVDGNKTTSTDSTLIDDNVSKTERTVEWGTSWDSMYWAVEQ